MTEEVLQSNLSGSPVPLLMLEYETTLLVADLGEVTVLRWKMAADLNCEKCLWEGIAVQPGEYRELLQQLTLQVSLCQQVSLYQQVSQCWQVSLCQQVMSDGQSG